MLRLRRLQIVDVTGRVRADLGVGDDDLVALTLFDPKGRARAVVRVDDGLAAFALTNADEAEAAKLTVVDPTPGSTLDLGISSLYLMAGSEDAESEIELAVAPGDERPSVDISADGAVQDLVTEVAVLRAELADLREHLATEVRTRRLVVEDGTGMERITAAADEDEAVLKVTASDPKTCVAIGASSSNAADVDVTLWGSGNAFASLEAHPVPNDADHDPAPHMVKYLSGLYLHQQDDEMGVVVDHAGLRSKAYERKRWDARLGGETNLS